MRWCSCISRKESLSDSLEEACDFVLDMLGQKPDIIFVFASGYTRAGYERLPSVLKTKLEGFVFGCTGHGVIGGGQEIEHSPAVSITAGLISNVTLKGSYVTADDLTAAPTCGVGSDVNFVAGTARSTNPIIVLAHPFSFPTERFLLELDQISSKQIVTGGLAGGGSIADDVMLFLEDDWYRSGAVLLSMGGNLQVVTSVAQGCRPIGEPMFITSDSTNSISALDGKNPLIVLDQLYKSLSSTEQALMRSSLFLGLGMRGGESVYEKGDYLIRNIIGSDRDTGHIVVGGDVRDNGVARFHVRDARTSRDDLVVGLKRLRNELGDTTELGGLVFSCAGRGAGLYGRTNHDLDIFKDLCGVLPLGGFFCNGEIGPVEGNSYLHAYTSSYAIFK